MNSKALYPYSSTVIGFVPIAPRLLERTPGGNQECQRCNGIYVDSFILPHVDDPDLLTPRLRRRIGRYCKNILGNLGV